MKCYEQLAEMTQAFTSEEAKTAFKNYCSETGQSEEEADILLDTLPIPAVEAMLKLHK